MKEANPSKYRDYISTLTSSANSGNEEARELLGKVGEDAARQRRGYEGLNKAIYIPAIIGAGALAAPSISASGKVVSWVYRQLPRWIRTGIDIGLTADGARNLFSKNGIQKTYREAKVGNYGKAALSGAVDILDLLGVNKNIDRSYSKLTSEEKRDVLDHELHHTIDLVFRGPKRQYSPMGKFLDFSKLDKGPNPNYFGEHIFVNGSSWNEVAPRVTQIKNFLGITDGKTLMTPESLRQGFEKYIESGRFDNDISTLYNAVTNWEEFAKWVNASVPSIGAYVLVRGSDGKIHGEKVEKHNIY